MHEKLGNHKMTPISKVDEILFELNENLKAILMMKALKYLRKHANQKENVLRQLHGHNFHFLRRMEERINIQFVVDRVKLESKNGAASW